MFPLCVSFYASAGCSDRYKSGVLVFCYCLDRLDLGDSQIGLISTVSKECWTIQDRSETNLTMVLAAHLMATKQTALLHHPPFEMLPQHMMCLECVKNKGLKWLRANLVV